MLATPPGTFLEILEFNVDPVVSADVATTARITFTDLDRAWAVHMRRGVAEVSEVVA